MTGPILFAGDPHRNFAPILRACLARPAGTLIVVGDCDCPVPLPEIIAPVTSAGWQVRWILGNHDTETERAYDNLVGAQPDGDLGLRVTEIAELRVAGLPGVFKPDDPVLALPIAPEFSKRLRAVLSGLPEEVFTADDGLG